MTALAIECSEALLTKQEVMERLKISRPTLDRAVKRGLVPPPIYVLPGQPRWPQSVIDDLIAVRKREAGYE